MSMRCTVAIAGLLVAAACGGREQAQRFAERGDAYVKEGRYDAAVIEYRNAIKQRPGWADVHRRLADAYVELGKAEDAYRAYSKAIDSDRSDPRACIGAGKLLLDSGLPHEADVRAEQALDRDPQNVDAQVLRGRALTRLKQFDDALQILEGAVRSKGGPAAYAALADARQGSGDDAGAAAAFREGVERFPQSTEAHLALADYLAHKEDNAAAEKQYLAAVSLDSSSETPNQSLAGFYIATGRVASAERYLEAAASAPHHTWHSTIALADYYLAAGRRDDARRILATIDGDQQARTAAEVRLATIDFDTGNAEKARSTIARIVSKRPTAEAWAVNARFLFADHRLDEAMQAAQAALDLNPDQPVAHYVAGSIAYERGDFIDADQEFREVLRTKTMTDAANLQLARTALAAGRPDDAIDLAQTAGNTLEARITLARALISAGQPALGRAELVRLDTLAPGSPEPAVLLGTLDLDDGNVPSAREYAARALKRDPNASDALVLAGKAAVAANDGAAAEQYLTRATTVAPLSFDAHTLLAHLYSSRGQNDKALGVFESLAKNNPQSAAARTAVGIVLERQSRIADARSWYEQALALDPTEPYAAHNLARIYSNDRSNPDAAVRLARVALTRLGDEAQAHDTLGWAYLMSGNPALAVTELQRATAMDPQSTVYRGHFDQARRALELEPKRPSGLQERPQDVQ